MNALPKIYFCGDIHSKFDQLYELTWRDRPDALVLLGDIQASQPLEMELKALPASTEVWFIHGNHDTDSEEDHDNLFESKLSDRNLDGKVVDVCGLKIAGLGGVFRAQVWYPPSVPRFNSAKEFLKSAGSGNRWRGGLPRKHRSTIFPDAVTTLAKLRADVLVTHEAPPLHRFGFAPVADLAQALRAQYFFHGHQHEDVDYDMLGINAYGVGLRGVVSLDGQRVLAGETDHCA